VTSENLPQGIDPTKAHPARRYNYWLGGKDNFAADRESAKVVASGFPTVQLAAQENRLFLQRVVSYLATEVGVEQFLDLGAGLPSAGNVHEVAQKIAPQSRVVYVDNDPIVLVHARALLTGTSQGATAYLQADIRNPDSIVTDPQVIRTLDLTKPVALMLVAVMHFLRDSDDPVGILRRLLEALPSGSHLVISHATSDHLTPEQLAASAEANERSGVTFRLRSSQEFSRFFEGLDLIEPGITSIVNWRSELPPEDRSSVEGVSMLCGVARLP
jgi:hypothetical protein